MKAWRIIDNGREKILSELYETETEALNEMRGLIAEDKLRRGCYAYDVQFLEDNITYKQYIDSIED